MEMFSIESQDAGKTDHFSNKDVAKRTQLLYCDGIKRTNLSDSNEGKKGGQSKSSSSEENESSDSNSSDSKMDFKDNVSDKVSMETGNDFKLDGKFLKNPFLN